MFTGCENACVAFATTVASLEKSLPMANHGKFDHCLTLRSHLAPLMEIRDFCGAGETVPVALAVEIVTGKSLRESSQMVMGAAGRQVKVVTVA